LRSCRTALKLARSRGSVEQETPDTAQPQREWFLLGTSLNPQAKLARLAHWCLDRRAVASVGKGPNFREIPRRRYVYDAADGAYSTGVSGFPFQPPSERRSFPMADVKTVGLDIAKNVFQAHRVDAEGMVIFSKKLSRGKVLDFFRSLPSCLVGLEACASVHHWA
jgi:hypothetical protein